MNDFRFYFELGWHHIISWDAFDHILFIVALSAIYLLNNWKQVLVLVTAFTIGHSLTLGLSVYQLVSINSNWVEFLIPLTIVATALFNLLLKDYQPASLRLNYFLALFFGLIHGLGFANTIRFMLSKDQQIALPLFSFNVGLEAGQVVMVSLLLILGYLLVNKLQLPRKWWVWGLSVFSLCWAAWMAIQRWPL
ncbi:MAG: HupE/UreJ family protein [Bacteroidetes bacterium]|nr:HupE/UreJ family protein [Bacteroidota bacterium]